MVLHQLAMFRSWYTQYGSVWMDQKGTCNVPGNGSNNWCTWSTQYPMRTTCCCCQIKLSRINAIIWKFKRKVNCINGCTTNWWWSEFDTSSTEEYRWITVVHGIHLETVKTIGARDVHSTKEEPHTVAAQLNWRRKKQLLKKLKRSLIVLSNAPPTGDGPNSIRQVRKSMERSQKCDVHSTEPIPSFWIINWADMLQHN